VRVILQSPRVVAALKKYTPLQMAQMLRAAHLSGDMEFVGKALDYLDRVYFALDLTQKAWIHEASIICIVFLASKGLL